MCSISIPETRLTLPKAADPHCCQMGLERWEKASAKIEDQDLGSFMAHALEDQKARPILEAVFGNSPYLTLSLLKDPDCLAAFLDKGPDQAFMSVMTDAKTALAKENDTTAMMKALRIFKRRAALIIALADITGKWSLESITNALTDLADTTLGLSVSHLLRLAAASGQIELAHPDEPERDCGLFIIAMGKQGAGELNYSSDVDLIVIYDEDKVTYTGKQTVKEMFIRMTRDLVRLMEERTGDGYVFRTDLRLRPDPGSTPPAISVLAAEAYYESFGQNWERAAMIKARICAGDKTAGEAFLKFLRPFIWRKSLDFYTIQDIHSIKRQIHAHKGGGTVAVHGHNIKLGRGGIREIEFFAQTQQLIWGGRLPELRTQRTVEALVRLTKAKHVGSDTRDRLEGAYRYLRTLEHRLQMTDDQQTQTLPKDEEKLRQLAVFFGYEGVEDFSHDLVQVLRNVEEAYADLFEEEESLSEDGNLVFTGGEDDPDTVETIKSLGYEKPSVVISAIKGWHHGRTSSTRSTRARQLLTELTPRLLRAFGNTVNPDQAFLKFNEFLSRLPTGVQLFSLFCNKPELLELVAEIMGDAPRLAAHLARYPATLEGVLTEGFLDPLPELDTLMESFDKETAQATSYEDILDRARRWANDFNFRVGVQILRDTLNSEQAGAALSAIAEAAVSRLMPRVEQELSKAHGFVPNGGISIIAMGKLGGEEMSSTSDIDLVLVYDTPDGITESTGPRAIGLSTFYMRITQRLINAITAMTNEGKLYEVDMRLRPSGNAGPIAVSIEAFEKYHEEAAWTWEHLALTRARVIYGQMDFNARLNKLIFKTLTRDRDPGQLLLDVDDMRQRLWKERKPKSIWEIKYARGGIVDIEFIAQYLQLRHAKDHPDILSPHNARALENIAQAGVMPTEQVQTLIEAYNLWMTLQNIMRLTAGGAIDEETVPEGLKARLVQASNAGDFMSLKSLVEDYLDKAYAIFQDIIETPAKHIRETKT